MKRVICLLLSCLILSGCSLTGDWVNEPVKFYYIRENYQNDMQQVIASEVREAAGHKQDLVYLLALYSMGPIQEGLMSPLPANTVIIPTQRTESDITLIFSESGQSMTDVDFTLSATCIAMTCMDLIELQQVTVACGERTITISEDNLLLDSSTIISPQEEIK